jgi:3-hydroxyisobutyrate dehydrogenase
MDLPGVLVIGLGNMGAPMASRAHAAGFDIRGADPAAAARADLAAAGIRVAADPVELLDGVGTVVLMLPSSAIVEQVLLADGLARELPAGTVVVDMSSSDPVRTRVLAATLADLSLRIVDAPVSGGVKGAVEGTLTIMAGGESADVDAVEALLLTMGSVTRTGAIGSGHALKALNNLLSAVSMLASSEALQAGRRFGLSDEVMLDVINASSGRSFSTQYKWPTFVVPETYNSGFSLGLLVKDMRTAVSLAQEVGLSARLGEAALWLWEQAADSLEAGADHTEIARFAAVEH